MSYSASDFVRDVVNAAVESDIIDLDAEDGDDLWKQATQVIAYFATPDDEIETTVIGSFMIRRHQLRDVLRVSRSKDLSDDERAFIEVEIKALTTVIADRIARLLKRQDKDDAGQT